MTCVGMHGCVFGKTNKGADDPPFSSSASIPRLLPAHTLDLVQISVWSERKHGGGGGRESFVSSAYWKCTVGVFPVWETVHAKLFPIAHIYLLWLAASASSVILFASCTKLIFFPKV